MSEFDVLKALSDSGGEMEWSALMNTDKSVQETSDKTARLPAALLYI